MADLHATYIKGEITLSDGSITSFSINPDAGWQQWGNDPSKLGDTVDLMDSLAEATADHLHESSPMPDPIASDQSKTAEDGILRYAADGSEVFPGATGVRKNQLALPYGCTRGLAPGVTVAWGARMIWPDDLVWDRQGCAGGEDGCAERTALLDWLGAGAGDAMRAKARAFANTTFLESGDEHVVKLHEDEVGKVVGSPQGSHGYFYVAAWLHEHATEVEA